VLLGWVTLLALPAPAVAWTTLEPTAEAGADLHVVVRNAGGEAARAVVPRLVWRHATVAGDGVVLEPGARHEWHLPLPPPPGPGSFPATVRVDYVDAAGRADSVPLVILVPTPTPGPVRATLEFGPLARVAEGRLTLDSSGDRPLAGRVVFVLPGAMSTEPESLPAQISPGGRTVVPLAIQSRGDVPPGPHRIYGVYEYAEAGEQHTVVATTELAAIADGGRRARPLLVGAAALAVTFALLAVAWRSAARRARVA
jgi:hypothetical protein